MVSPFSSRERGAAAHVAEVGPGTGAFTREIARQMDEGDTLDVYDINEAFLDYTGRLVKMHEDFARVRERVRLHRMDARELDHEAAFDFLVSGLPFNNFGPAIVRDILEAYGRSTRPGGVISFFEYVGARRARKLLARRTRRQEIEGLDGVLRAHIDRYQERSSLVLANIPPALVHHLRR